MVTVPIYPLYWKCFGMFVVLTVMGMITFAEASDDAGPLLSKEETIRMAQYDEIDGKRTSFNPKTWRGNPDALEDLYKMIADPNYPLRKSYVVGYIGYIGNEDDIDKLIGFITGHHGVVEGQEVWSIEAAMGSLAELNARGVTRAGTELRKMMDPEFWKKQAFTTQQGMSESENEMAYEALQCYAWADDPEYPAIAQRVLTAIEASHPKDRDFKLRLKSLMEYWQGLGENYRKAGISRIKFRPSGIKTDGNADASGPDIAAAPPNVAAVPGGHPDDVMRVAEAKVEPPLPDIKPAAAPVTPPSKPPAPPPVPTPRNTSLLRPGVVAGVLAVAIVLILLAVYAFKSKTPRP